MVSNRGPVTYGRDESGTRITRRGGGGLVTAIDSLASDYDVTWIASAISDEDRAVAQEADHGAFDEVSRRGSPFRLRLVASRSAAFDRHYNVVANPMLWFIQHRLWDLVRAPALDESFHEAWHGGYVEVNPGFADAIVDELEQEPGRDGVLPRLPPVPRPETRSRALPGRATCALRAHPVGQRRRLERAAAGHAVGSAQRPAGQRSRRLSHRALAAAVRRGSVGHGRRRPGRRHDRLCGPRDADYWRVRSPSIRASSTL